MSACAGSVRVSEARGPVSLVTWLTGPPHSYTPARAGHTSTGRTAGPGTRASWRPSTVYRATMSVQETYAIAVKGLDEGLTTAARLASNTRAALRWVALWTARPLGSEFTAHFGPRLLSQTMESEWMLCLPGPTIDDIRYFAAHAGDDPVCIHWSPALYVSDEGPDAPWISFVDGDGRKREDARVYGFELAGNAIPLTTGADRPSDANFIFGPIVATGWELRLIAIRDHMPREELLRWLGEATSAPVTSIQEGRWK